MKKTLLLIILSIILTLPMDAKPFDYTFINGIKIGMKKSEVDKIIQKYDMKVEKKKNDDGGFYYQIKSDSLYRLIKLDDIRFNYDKNSKIKMILIDFANYEKIKSELAIMEEIYCNCKYVYDDDDIDYHSITYNYDDVQFIVNSDKGRGYISKITRKCK